MGARPQQDIVRPFLVMGTRPEAIKLAPVIHAAQADPRLAPIVCVTGQHREMLQQVTDYFGIRPDHDLAVMAPNQSLAQLTCRCLEGLDRLLAQEEPDCVVAQGDTTTVLAASLAAFYRRIPFVHVEAGLRTGNLYSPWPEELNRRIASVSTAIHCAPTPRAADVLRHEGYDPATIHVTGNTVIDALLWTLARERGRDATWRGRFPMLDGRGVVLITGHRRENFGGPLAGICQAIADLSRRFPELQFVYPVHLNPNVQQPVHQALADLPNVFLVPPCAYPEFVWLMDRSTLIISDSGGVQEEAPSLRKPVLVTRDTTERPEAVEAGAVELVGADPQRIVARATELLTDPAAYARRVLDHNPYGDGQAAPRIAALLRTCRRAGMPGVGCH